MESLNESEQYSHRNCLLLYWIKEESKEDKDDVIYEVSIWGFRYRLRAGLKRSWQDPPFWKAK